MLGFVGPKVEECPAQAWRPSPEDQGQALPFFSLVGPAACPRQRLDARAPPPPCGSPVPMPPAPQVPAGSFQELLTVCGGGDCRACTCMAVG